MNNMAKITKLEQITRLIKSKDGELLFETFTNKGQQYYEVLNDWHRIKWVKIDGKKVKFRVVIELEKPVKDYGEMRVKVK